MPAVMHKHPVFFTVLKWIGIAIAAVLVLTLAILALFDGNQLKGPIERFASAKSGRTVKIAGDLVLHPWSFSPSATIDGLSIDNPSWEHTRQMANIERISVQMKLLPLLKGDVILPRVSLERPQLYLHRDAGGRANWTFANTAPSDAPAPPPPKLPVVRDFLIEGGKVKVVDEIRKLDFDATVQAHEKQSANEPKPFRIEGQGKLNKEPFKLHVAGGPLINLTPDQPYPFDIAVHAGTIEASADGVIPKPFDMSQLHFVVKTSGDDLADLFYLTQLALPNTPHFAAAASIDRKGDTIRVSDIAGKVGSSDVGGELTIDASRKRPRISGDLKSKHLRLADLAASLGSGPAKPGTLEPTKGAAARPARAQAKNKAPPPAAVPRLFPDAKLQVDRVRAMDADVRFAAGSIDSGRLPLKEVSFRVKLDDGVLAIAPLAFELPQGKLGGSVRIDARGKLPRSQLDVRIRNVQLDQLKGKAPDAQPPLGGVLDGRLALKGSGSSVHDFVADSNGTLTVALPSGEIRAAFAELTGINIARGIGLLLKGDEDRTEIRCGIAAFDVVDGTMRARKVVFDTKNVVVRGSGEVRLGPEELDLSIKGQPKKLRFLRLRSPIEVHGHLLKPAVGISAGKAIKQGAVAAAIGVVATPVAALLAFIDPGKAEDQQCWQLLDEADQTTR